MPFRSKAQQRFMFAAEARGEIPKGTAKRWAEETPNIKKLPERVHKKESAAYLAGVEAAFAEFLKEARVSLLRQGMREVPAVAKQRGAVPRVTRAGVTTVVNPQSYERYLSNPALQQQLFEQAVRQTTRPVQPISWWRNLFSFA